jgi:membrane protein YqaA with SNARE-associated domain
MSFLAQHPFKRFSLGRAVALVSALLLSLLIFAFRDSLHELEPLGYAGVFLVALIGNATLILPAPVLVFVYVAGGTLGSPLLVGLLAGLGATLGEMTGYLAGFSSSGFIERNQAYNRVKKWVEDFGAWTIGVLAFLPNPLFDLAGFAAGTLGLRLRWFLLATFIGKVLKTTLVAYAGSMSIGWVERVFL